ncbi:Fic family protein, partial [Patescibacteria group bacterium]|nr:Fic family protein [Patescibacteria group bacterium]
MKSKEHIPLLYQPLSRNYCSCGSQSLFCLSFANSSVQEKYCKSENKHLLLSEISKKNKNIQYNIYNTKNLARVVSYIDKKAKEQELTLDVILLLHKMLISNIRDDIAGRFRKDNEFVRVGNYIAPNPKEVLDRLEKMMVEYNAASSENIIKRIAKLHLAFEYTHPFNDGNGRIGRVLNNYLLIREGF